VVRVALVSEPPYGGVATHVRWLARGLPTHGYEPVVVVPSDFPYLDELDGVCEVVTLPLRRDYTHPYDELRALVGLVPVIRRTVLVHAHSSKAGVLARVGAKLVRRPAVYTPHGFPFVGEMSSMRRQFGVVVERALAPATAALICVCDYERGLASQKALRPQSVAVVHNGCPPCAAADPAEMPQGLIVGTVCSLRPAKALDCLLDAMPVITAAVPDAKLVIVGEGELAAQLRGYAARLGIEATWLPFSPPPSRYLVSFDVFVLSSAWEAFPIGVLEAQACGVPQVVAGVGGTRESVVPDTGIVVPPRCPEALAEAIIQLLRDPLRRAEMSTASRERHAERFTVERMVADTAAVYDRVLAAR
jgi:glycosyltransferase involved in cell wall biosynthesis